MKLGHLKAGDVVVLDDGFDCMPAGRATVETDGDGRLFVCCGEGRHFLDGQLRDDGTLSGVFWPGETEEQAAFRARLEAAGLPAPWRAGGGNRVSWVDAENGQSILETFGGPEIVKLAAQAVNLAAWGCSCATAGADRG